MLRFLCLFALVTPALLAQQTAPKASYPETRLFGIILLQGLKKPAPEAEELPSKTQKVLEEVSDFLPYKHFKMLDSSFIRSNSDSRFNLVGPDKQALIATMSIRKHPEYEDTILVRGFEIQELTTRHDGEKRIPTMIDYISTSFSIKLGETIVVGTSRIGKEDNAVIILFSAG